LGVVVEGESHCKRAAMQVLAVQHKFCPSLAIRDIPGSRRYAAPFLRLVWITFIRTDVVRTLLES